MEIILILRLLLRKAGQFLDLQPAKSSVLHLLQKGS